MNKMNEENNCTKLSDGAEAGSENTTEEPRHRSSAALPDVHLHPSPLVFWAQTIEQITLKVDLNDAEPPFVNFTNENIFVKAKGRGARGLNDYVVKDNKIEFTLQKSENGWWPRLVATPQKPHWLRIDFDRWRTDDDMLEEKPRDIMKDYSSEYKRLQKREFGYIKESKKKVYMVFYNLAQFIGYLYILSVISVLYYRDGVDFMPKCYATVGAAMKFCQLLQYMEVLHPIFGYTKGGALVPFFQVTGRNFILFLMIEMEERMHAKPVVFYVFIIWSLVEVFRYPYYITQILRKEFSLLTWIRYTIWIPLYPMGILCEGIIILRNIPYFEETQLLSLKMPNKWNFIFDMPLFMKIYLMLLVLPGTYLLITHMAKTRAKKLGGRAPSRIRKLSN